MYNWSPLDLNDVLKNFGDHPEFTRGIIAVSRPGQGLIHSIMCHIAGRPYEVFRAHLQSNACSLGRFLYANRNKIVVIDEFESNDNLVINMLCAASDSGTITYMDPIDSNQTIRFKFNGIIIIPCHDIDRLPPGLINRCIELNFG